MGVDIIVLRKSDFPDCHLVGDQIEYKSLARYIFDLDKIFDLLSVRRLSDFIDSTGMEEDMFEEIHGEEAPENWRAENIKWFEPREAIISIKRILEYIESDDYFSGEYLSDDLQDCLRILEIAEQEKDLFCLSQIF